MLTTTVLLFLFALVIAGGVLTLLKGLEKHNDNGSKILLDKLKNIKDQNVIVGGALIGVGVIGLFMSVYMGYFHNIMGSNVPKSNFGFRFY